MSLRIRLMICLNALLLVTVTLISGLTLFNTVHSQRARARRDALGTASLLASITSASINAPEQIEGMIAEQMVVQARLAAHLVKLAETRAGLSPKEINAILDDVTRHTALNELWITDEKGVAYLYSTPSQIETPFRFSPDPELQPQAHLFWPLLKDRTGRAVVVQKTRRRELDSSVHKYVGISGLDKPRIVQVAYRAEFIQRLADRFAVHRLVERLITAGSLQEIFVVQPDGRLATSASPAGKVDLAKDYYAPQLDVLAADTMQTRQPQARFSGSALEACVPLMGFGPNPGALVCRFSTRELDQARSSALAEIVKLSIAGLIAGALLSNVLAKRVSGPVRKLAEAARAVGSGKLGHRVPVESNDEVGQLGDSFNRMAASLETYVKELAQSTAEKEALRREMDIAAEIQRSLLPESCPKIDGFDVAARSAPAHEVGGDFYDFIPLPGDRWGLVIADASGQGVPAALLMALSRSLIRAYSQSGPSILSALELANRYMVNDMRSEMFITCFYAVLDPAQRTLRYVNAGHNPPALAQPEGNLVMLGASGMPLGILDESGIREETCALGPDDVVMMYTDGITEAMSAYGEQFGVPRLEEILKNALRLSAADISARIHTAVERFASGQPQFDDMTTVVLKVL